MIPSDPPKLKSRLPRKLKAWIEEVRQWLTETQAIPGAGMKARETARGREFKLAPVAPNGRGKWFGVRARKTNGAQALSVTPTLVTFNNDTTFRNYDPDGLFTSSVFTSPANCYVMVHALLPISVGTEDDTLPTITVKLIHTPLGLSDIQYPQVTSNTSKASSGGLKNRIPIHFILSLYVGAGDTLSIYASEESSYNNYTIDSGDLDGAVFSITRLNW